MISWRRLDRELIYDGQPWVSLFKDTISLPDRRVIDDYYHLKIPDFVAIFAITNEGEVVTLKQYKHALGRETLTLPGGQIEADELPEQAARREFFEETGYIARHWKSIGTYIVNGNMGAGRGHMYMASRAEKISEVNSGDLEVMHTELIPPEQLRDMITEGRLELLNHAAAISIALLHLS